jgi:PIN domain nuclease of toxin-antitoxin system
VEILLDTHVAMWWAIDPSMLATPAASAIADKANAVWFSTASAWELAIKVRSGKLEVDVLDLVAQLSRHGMRILGIGVDDAVAAGSLEWEHRDPFDRMLVAQARRLGLRLVTRDAAVLDHLRDAIEA